MSPFGMFSVHFLYHILNGLLYFLKSLCCFDMFNFEGQVWNLVSSWLGAIGVLCLVKNFLVESAEWVRALPSCDMSLTSIFRPFPSSSYLLGTSEHPNEYLINYKSSWILSQTKSYCLSMQWWWMTWTFIILDGNFALY